VDKTLFHEIWTVVLLIVFIGIWAWAWSRKRKKSFDEAAQLPLEDDGGKPQTKKPGAQS
jgi:cytochrome c oxidase cbb3-type subunit 4